MVKLEKFLLDIGIPYTSDTLNKFELYYQLLIEWNNKFNLTAITDKDEVITKHFADSLYGYNQIVGSMSVVDIGSGAGFPSLPLAIVCSDVEFTLVDSLNKRVLFLNEVINKLSLRNCKAIHSRAEDFASINRNKYDVAVARAVASLPTLLEYLIPLVKVNGKTVCYKAVTAEEEIANSKNALLKLNASFTQCEEYNIIGTDYKRNLVVCTVNSVCDSIYPRIQNLPKSKPL